MRKNHLNKMQKKMKNVVGQMQKKQKGGNGIEGENEEQEIKED